MHVEFLRTFFHGKWNFFEEFFKFSCMWNFLEHFFMESGISFKSFQACGIFLEHFFMECGISLNNLKHKKIHR